MTFRAAYVPRVLECVSARSGELSKEGNDETRAERDRRVKQARRYNEANQ